MSKRPDIAARLEAGETLVWQGHPKPGRRAPLRVVGYAALLAFGSFALLLVAGWVELFQAPSPAWRLTIYLLIASAAFLTYFALRITVLKTRRDRARDAHTAYAITDRRALTLSGPYAAELPVGSDTTADLTGDRLIIQSGADSLRFDRLTDAAAAQDILMRQIQGGS